ncbi:hypothetical protein ROZALSC1DRAFT_29665, partial [Rozella allomycis CSF55]
MKRDMHILLVIYLLFSHVLCGRDALKKSVYASDLIYLVEGDKQDEVGVKLQLKRTIKSGQQIDVSKFVSIYRTGPLDIKLDLFGLFIKQGDVFLTDKILSKAYNWIFSTTYYFDSFFLYACALGQIKVVEKFIDRVKPEDRWVLKMS